ncbi:MAG: TRAP transporter substrate-binding protein [Pseudolabrys sp.]|nr:TRAP transporter substrate-binding protein [Pseudolabrys sp.]
MQMRKVLFAATLALLGGSAASAAEYELKMSLMFPPTHFIQTRAMEPWAKMIEQKTNGRVHFTIFSAGSALGDATKQFDQVRSGVVDVAVSIPAIPRGRHPRTTLMELPFTIKSSKAGTLALMDLYDKYLKADFPGTVMLNMTITEPSAVHTKQPITDLDQLKGVRVRAPTPSVTAMLNAMGATPVGMPPTQIYESAERGVIDGNVMPWGPVGAFKLYEVFHNHLNARIDAVTMYTLMNENRYKALPADIRKVIDDSKPFLVDIWTKMWKETDDAAIETARKAGNKIVDLPDARRNEWRAKMKPVVDQYIAEQTKTVPNSQEIYDAMTAALKKYE